MSDYRVSSAELEAILADVEEDIEGYEFHRIQDGYGDGVPRAVFVHANEEPIGIPVRKGVPMMLSLVARLAADLRDARAQTEGS